jgi:hypothetical protein
MFCRFLIASLMMMSFATARAAIIGADQAALAGHQSDRAAVMSVLERDDVANGLKAYGVDPNAAKARVAAMTDSEVAALRGQLGALPAGGTDWGWWVGAVVVIAVLVWFFWGHQ